MNARPVRMNIQGGNTEAELHRDGGRSTNSRPDGCQGAPGPSAARENPDVSAGTGQWRLTKERQRSVDARRRRPRRDTDGVPYRCSTALMTSGFDRWTRTGSRLSAGIGIRSSGNPITRMLP